MNTQEGSTVQAYEEIRETGSVLASSAGKVTMFKQQNVPLKRIRTTEKRIYSTIFYVLVYQDGITREYNVIGWGE